MKKMMKLWALLAVAAVGFTACRDYIEEENLNVVEKTVTIDFFTDAPESRTSVDTSGEKPLFSWDEVESFAVLEQTDALAEAKSVLYAKVDEKATITTTFDAKLGQESYTYVAVYPKTAYVAESTESLESATLSLPAAQTMNGSSYDPEADLMVSKPVSFTAQPTEAQLLQFTRVAAVVEMTLKGLALEGEDAIEEVIFTADNQALAGTVSADLNDPHTFEAAEPINSISVATDAPNNKVCFTTLPATLAEGNTYSIMVVTGKYIYLKTGTIGTNALEFQTGNVTRFGVNMATATKSYKWELVKDASTLQSGDIVTVAAKNANRVMGSASFTNYPYASKSEIIKSGDYLYHPIEVDAYNQRIRQFILAERGEGFDIYNGVDYEGDTKTGYLYASKSGGSYTSKHLKLQAYPNENTLFYISINEGVAAIQARDSEFTNNYMQYYEYSANYQYFQLWGESEITDERAVCLYRRVGGEPIEIPVAGANFSVPKSVVLEKEAVAETVLEDAEFNYVGEWSISTSAKVKDSEEVAEWLTVAYDEVNNLLTYAAEENVGTVRYATVTVRATLSGEEDIVKSFEVTQKGLPQTITLADFVDQPSDANIEYIVTGRISEIPDSKNGGYEITDGENTATISYLYTEEDEAVKENVELKEGDVITVRTASTGSGKGGTSSAHAVYLGYYNISAVEPAEVSYTGGEATITINKEGTLIPNEVFGGSEGEAFVTLTLPEAGSNEATVDFEANASYPRQSVVTFTYGLATVDVLLVQGANPDPLKRLNWVLVEDATELKETDIVAIAAQGYDKALSTTISSDRRSATDITKIGNYLVPSDPAAIQELVLINGTESGTFALYDATNEGFIASTSTSTGSASKLQNQAYNDENSSFKITISEGVTTIGNVAGDYDENVISYKSSYGFYSAESVGEPVCLYRLVGVSGSVPMIKADVTVPNEDVVITEDASTANISTEVVSFNYVGDWTIEVSSSEDWLDVAYDAVNNCLTYTAEANTSGKRTAAVTITASKEGQENIVFGPFNIMQKGAPQDSTIEAFIGLEADPYSTYKLTGKVVKAATNATNSGYVLADENDNQVTINYLDTELGENVWGHDDFTLQVGDVVTVTAVPAGSKKGGTSANPAIYKGHYRLTAEVTPTVVSWEGGDATIELAIETNGNVEAPTTIAADPEACDYATFTYTGGDTATVTFVENAGSSRDMDITFTSGMTEITVAVAQENNPSVKVGWFLVKDASELAVGDKIIIAAKSPDGTLDYAFIKQTSSSSANKKGQAITLTGDTISSDVTTVEEFTLESGHTNYPGTWAFKGTSYNKYLYASSGTLSFKAAIDQYGSWAISIDSDGKATLTCQYGPKNTMMLNYTAYNQNFAAFAPTQADKGAIYIYKYYN